MVKLAKVATPADLARAEAAGAKIIEMLESVATAYVARCQVSVKPQSEIFAELREDFTAHWGLSPIRAAAWARLVVAFAKRQAGQAPYDPAEMAEILNTALG